MFELGPPEKSQRSPVNTVREIADCLTRLLFQLGTSRKIFTRKLLVIPESRDFWRPTGHFGGSKTSKTQRRCLWDQDNFLDRQNSSVVNRFLHTREL